MIVTYKREWAIIRIEDIRAIQIVELEKAENHSRGIVKILKKIYPEIEKENILLKDLVFEDIKRQYRMIILDSKYKQAGYKYVVLVDTIYGTFTLPMKKLGNEEAAQMLFDGSKEIKYVKISEEEGVVEVKLTE